MLSAVLAVNGKLNDDVEKFPLNFPLRHLKLFLLLIFMNWILSYFFIKFIKKKLYLELSKKFNINNQDFFIEKNFSTIFLPKVLTFYKFTFYHRTTHFLKDKYLLQNFTRLGTCLHRLSIFMGNYFNSFQSILNKKLIKTFKFIHEKINFDR